MFIQNLKTYESLFLFFLKRNYSYLQPSRKFRFTRSFLSLDAVISSLRLHFVFTLSSLCLHFLLMRLSPVPFPRHSHLRGLYFINKPQKIVGNIRYFLFKKLLLRIAPSFRKVRKSGVCEGERGLGF